RVLLLPGDPHIGVRLPLQPAEGGPNPLCRRRGLVRHWSHRLVRQLGDRHPLPSRLGEVPRFPSLRLVPDRIRPRCPLCLPEVTARDDSLDRISPSGASSREENADHRGPSPDNPQPHRWILGGLRLLPPALPGMPIVLRVLLRAGDGGPEDEPL